MSNWAILERHSVNCPSPYRVKLHLCCEMNDIDRKNCYRKLTKSQIINKFFLLDIVAKKPKLIIAITKSSQIHKEICGKMTFEGNFELFVFVEP